MESPHIPPKPCSICNEPTPLKCKSCNSSAYCSQKCQKEDWSIHKLLCGQRKLFSTPPDTNFRRAIYFPVHEKKPKFVWFPVEMRRMGGGAQEEEGPDFTVWLGERSFGVTNFERNEVRKRSLDNQIYVVGKCDAWGSLWIPPLEVNECVEHVTNGKNVSLWRGPTLAVKVVGRCPRLYGDIDVADLRDVADYFTCKNLSSGIDWSGWDFSKLGLGALKF